MHNQTSKESTNPNIGDTGLVIDDNFNGGALPVQVSLADASRSWRCFQAEIAALVEKVLPVHGGILFRGLKVESEEESGAESEADFQRFTRGFGFPLLSYEFGSTPRTALAEGVYTSTEYPAHQQIPLHNEQAYTSQWPLKIWFHCVTPAREGGETPVADSRRIYRHIDPAIRARFESRGLMYVRNYGNGLDVPWPRAFNVDAGGADARRRVEDFCRRQGIGFEWKADGELRTRQTCQATVRHPRTGEWVWFNQAHLFHVSNLEPVVRETLLDIVMEEDLPRNVYYGDGAAIEDSVLEEIRAVMDREMVVFPWRRGDVLMLDNMLAAHGRLPFKGERKVVVAMAEGFDSNV